jgi:hypothetical protein
VRSALTKMVEKEADENPEFVGLDYIDVEMMEDLVDFGGFAFTAIIHFTTVSF